MARFTAEQKRECAALEVENRRRVYPKWISNGSITDQDALKQIGMMEEIAHEYELQATREFLEKNGYLKKV